MSTVKKNGTWKIKLQNGADEQRKCFRVKLKISSCEISSCVGRAGAGLLPIHGNKLGDAGLLHGHAVKDGSHLHGAAVVRHHDELGIRAHLCQHLSEAAAVGLVERRLHLLPDAKWAGLAADHSDQQSQERDGLFTTRKPEN